jgi:sulfite reductase (ferredoxin)
MACTGIQFCKLAFVDTKDTATATIAELENRLSDVKLELPITLNLNGCPNSCARIQTADIGLKGQILTGADGEPEFGYQVHLGGGLANSDREDPGLGRTVRGLKVSAEELPAYVERVVRSFVDSRDKGETFSAWAKRSDEQALR